MPSDGVEIQHDRECQECGSTTYQFERCHVCGDVPWKDGGS
jgi:hypothetical protein